MLPTRVIDVGAEDGSCEPRLYISHGGCGEWVALSHCWGRGVILQTTIDNIDARTKHLSLNELTPTARDAVYITRRLQIRYLWINSLCVIQDSEEDWDQESQQMVRIYANAVVTVSADAAAGDADGILDHGSQERSTVAPVKFPYSLEGGPMDYVYIRGYSAKGDPVRGPQGPLWTQA